MKSKVLAKKKQAVSPYAMPEPVMGTDKRDIARMLKQSLFERRAATVMYRRYKINRYELWTLCGLSAALMVLGRKAISQDEYRKQVTANLHAGQRIRGYWEGLKRLEMIERWEYAKGKPGESWAVSELGRHVVKDFAETLAAREREYLETTIELDGIMAGPEGIKDYRKGYGIRRVERAKAA